MADVGIVLVHGGQHAGDCWEPTVTEIGLQAPGTPVLAVDLPGRRPPTWPRSPSPTG